MGEKSELQILRHSASHILAIAIKELYPKAQLGMGPAIEEGFYYDFDNLKISEEDIPKIEEKIKEVIKRNLKFEKIDLSVAEAKKILKDEPYKLELLKDIQHPTFYKTGDFIDLCAGPHVRYAKEAKAIKIMKLAGAYWKGDSKNKMLTRIYGTAFGTKEEMDKYLTLLEEAKLRDHRKIGKDMELFFFHEYSPGSAFFEANGAIIYNELVKFIREEYVKRGYKEVITPLLYDKALWETSGHWEHYKDDMFLLKIDGKEFSLKPMNCPSHLLIFKNRMRSYKELPLRIADFASLHRNELKGVLGGLTRVRKFCQDDAHIFVTEKQLEKELDEILEFVDFVYKKTFNFDYSLGLSTRPEKYLGDVKLWDKAEKLLEDTMKKHKIPYVINKGEGVFYGPKIDCKVKDSLGREWQLATIQLDFNMPLRFEAVYEGEDGKRHTPIMIHRAILGSPDRFLGVFTEHCAGKFPLWLSPVQVIVMPVSEKHIGVSRKLYERLFSEGIRAELDDRSETVPRKVRDAQMRRIPYMITIGDKEIEKNKLAVRDYSGKVKFDVDTDKFIKSVLRDVKERRNTLSSSDF